ncbi:MAG: hypothetical protein HN888_03450 [Desulfobacula sp.]|nr:hypothetical protein [Desulfobacula sp.]
MKSIFYFVFAKKMRRILIKICLTLMVVLLAFGITLAIEFYLTAHIDKLLKTHAAKASPEVDIYWKDIQIRLFSLDVVLHHAEVKASNGHQFGIEKIILSNTLRLLLKLDNAKIRMEGIHFLGIPDHIINITNKISCFDRYKMKAFMNIEAFYDSSLHNLNIKKLKLIDKNWGHLQLKLVLNNFYPWQIRNFQFEPLLIQTIDIKYQDYAILKQFMDCNSEKNHEFRNFMVEAIKQIIETTKKQKNQDKEKSLAVLQNFFNNPGQLIFKMQLRQPVSISQIINARRVSELLEMIHYSFTNA